MHSLSKDRFLVGSRFSFTIGIPWWCLHITSLQSARMYYIFGNHVEQFNIAGFPKNPFSLAAMCIIVSLWQLYIFPRKQPNFPHLPKLPLFHLCIIKFDWKSKISIQILISPQRNFTNSTSFPPARVLASKTLSLCFTFCISIGLIPDHKPPKVYGVFKEQGWKPRRRVKYHRYAAGKRWSWRITNFC